MSSKPSNKESLSSRAKERLSTVKAHLAGKRGRHERLSELPPPPTPKARLVPSADPDSFPVSGSHRLTSWTSPPRSILIIHKRGDSRVDHAVGRILSYIAETYSDLRILVEDHTASAHPGHDLIVIDTDEAQLCAHTDLVLTIGGDGTMLHVSHLFSQGECPPVLCFSLGTLGFLLPFHIESFVDVLHTTLDGPVSILYRMRLKCTPLDSEGLPLARCSNKNDGTSWQVMNELVLNRGGNSHLAVLDAYLNDEYLTEAIADGVLLSTPTGSTAYNLSAGGPISHPETDAMMLTPIAPRSLSFRSVVLPGTARVKLRIADRARAPATLSLDGREVGELEVGESVVVSRAQWPMPCIERGGGPAKGWVKDINSLLLFNTGFVNKSRMKRE